MRPLKQCAFLDIKEDFCHSVVHYGTMIGKTKNGVQIFNSNAELLSDFYADDICFPEESKGMMAFCKGSKWGFVTPHGQIVISPSFEEARSFSQGYAAVKLNGKWGYIDTTGKLIIPCEFKEAGAVTPQGSAWIKNQAGYQLLKLSIYETK